MCFVLGATHSPVEREREKKIENLNRPITSREIELVIIIINTGKSPVPNGFTGEFYQTFEELQALLKSRKGGNTSQLIL